MMLQSVPDKDEWSRLTLVRLVKFCRRLSAKYRRETVRNLLPKHAAETLEAVSYTHLDVYKRQVQHCAVVAFEAACHFHQPNFATRSCAQRPAALLAERQAVVRGEVSGLQRRPVVLKLSLIHI